MLAQEILPEVARKVAPDGMNVVGVVLGVVVFDEERRALHAVVVFLSLLDLAGPRERDLLDPGLR